MAIDDKLPDDMPACTGCGHVLDLIEWARVKVFRWNHGYDETDAEPQQMTQQNAMVCGHCGYPVPMTFFDFWDEHVR
jgi:hypothetical protein